MPDYLDFLRDQRISKLVRQVFTTIVEQQNLEYGPDIKVYLKSMQGKGLPFKKDYSEEPFQIQQIKNLLNGLFYVEQVFIKLEKSLDAPFHTLLNLPNFTQEAYLGSYLLTHLGVETMDAFRSELAPFMPYLDLLQSLSSSSTTFAKKHSEYAFSMGSFVGYWIAQMKSTPGTGNYDALGKISSHLPKYIDRLRLLIETLSPNLTDYTPNVRVNYKQLAAIKERSEQLVETLKETKDLMGFILNIYRLLTQLWVLFKDIDKQIGFLDESTQRLFCEYLATIKYQWLPQLFGFVDQVELQFLLERGRIAAPLMAQIKPLYEQIIALSRSHIYYKGHDLRLLKLEDRQFNALRLAPITKALKQAKLTLHQIEQALAEIDPCLELIERGSPFDSNLRESFARLEAYLAPLKDGLNDNIRASLPGAAFIHENLLKVKQGDVKFHCQNLRRLKTALTQLKNNDQFKIKLREALKRDIRLNARLTLNSNIMVQDEGCLIQDRAVLLKRHLLRDELTFSTIGEITNPERLTAVERWDLYAAYQNRLTEIDGALEASDELLRAIDSKQFFQRDILEFVQTYPVKKRDSGPFKPNILYCEIQEGELIYHTRTPSNAPYFLYLLSLPDALKAHVLNAYTWDYSSQQLNFIASDGQIEENITYTSRLKNYIKRWQKYHPFLEVLPLTAEQITQFITLHSEHRPVDVHQGRISIMHWGCSVPQITDIKTLSPYLAHFFAELYERGHIIDRKRKEVINAYALIQPFLHTAGVGSQDTATFDQGVVSALMPNIYPGEASSRPFKLLDFKLGLNSFKNHLTLKRTSSEMKFRLISAGIKEVLIHPLHAEINISQAGGLGAEMVHFLASSLPLEQLIMSSQKELFKVAALGEYLSLESKQRILIQHRYLVDYHNGLLAQFNALKPFKCDYRPKMAQESAGLRILSPKYEICLMDNKPLKPGKIQISINAEILYYQFIYYGQILKGEMPLQLTFPRLRSFDHHTLLKPETYVSILQYIFNQRMQQIIDTPEVLIVDEALDLYQWFSMQALKFELTYQHYQRWQSALEHLKSPVQADKTLEALYNQVKPVLMKMVLPELVDTFAKAFKFSKQSNKLNNLFEIQKNLIRAKRENYRLWAYRLLIATAHLIPPSPAPSVNITRTHHLLKDETLSKTLTELQGTLAQFKKLMNPALATRCQVAAYWWGMPYPEMEHSLKKWAEPHQVVGFKRLNNLIYLLTQASLELERIKRNDTKFGYVMHVVKGYFSVKNSLFLINELAADPYLHWYAHDLLKKFGMLWSKAKEATLHFIPKDEEHVAIISSLNYVLIALYELPIQMNALALGQEPSPDESKSLRQRALLISGRANRVMMHVEEKIRMINRVNLFFEPFLQPAIEGVIDSWEYQLLNSLRISLEGLVAFPLLFETQEVKFLFKELQQRALHLVQQVHLRVTENILSLRTEVIKKIILEVEELEVQWNARPGSAIKPVQSALDQFYLGFIARLVPEMPERIALITHQGTLFTDRLAQACRRKEQLEKDLQPVHNKINLLQKLLDYYANNRSYEWSWCGRQAKSDYSNLEFFEQLNEIYGEILPLFIATLLVHEKSQQFPYLRHTLSRGCRMLFMTEAEALAEGERDCLVWSVTTTIPSRPKLVYVSLDGDAETIELKSMRQFIEAFRSKAPSQPIHFSGEELHRLITKNRRVTPIFNEGPFQLQPELLLELKKPLPLQSNAEERRKFDLKIQRLLPVFELCKAYYQGVIATMEITIESNTAQIEFIEAQQRNQPQVTSAQIKRLYEDYFYKQINAISATPEYAVLSQVNYQTELTEALIARQAEIFAGQILNENLTQHIHTELQKVCAEFNARYMEHYTHLAQVQRVLQRFKKYLQDAKEQCCNGQSLFENQSTLKAKMRIIREMEEDLNDKTPADKRLKAIQDRLSRDLPVLLQCSKRQAGLLNVLNYYVTQLLIACGLYTPQFIQQVEALGTMILHKEPMDINAKITREAIKAQGFFALAQLKSSHVSVNQVNFIEPPQERFASN